MAVAKSLDKTLFLYTDNTVSSMKLRKSSVPSVKSVYQEPCSRTLHKPCREAYMKMTQTF